MNFIKKNYKYLLVFLLFFIINCVYSYQNCSSYDTLWNYGFSHAIRIGEIPYLDFNTISTPLYSFVMSIGLFIWDDLLMFLIEHNILVTILFCIFFKMFGKKGWIMFPVLTLPFFLQLNATYNFFSFFLIVLLIYYEREDRNDILIGIVLGFLLITKHTIGIPVLICSLISTFDKKKIFRRIIFALIPIFILLIYLIVTKSLIPFIDLCIFGLFDFGSKNHSNINFFMIFSICLVILIIISIVKNPRNKNYYYALGAFSFCIPLFDWYHIGLFIGIIIIGFVDKISLPDKYIRNMSFLLVFIVCFFYSLMMPTKFLNLTFFDVDHLRYMILKQEDKNNDKIIIKKYKEYKNAYMLDDVNIKYDLAVDKKITYFDVLLKGNYGYNGTNKMIEKISKMHDTYFFIDKNKYLKVSDSEQFDVKIIKYTIENSEKVDNILNFDIYYKE